MKSIFFKHWLTLGLSFATLLTFNYSVNAATSYVVQVGAYDQRLAAEHDYQLRKKTIAVNARIRQVLVKGRTWYQLQLGPFQQLAQAEVVRKKSGHHAYIRKYHLAAVATTINPKSPDKKIVSSPRLARHLAPVATPVKVTRKPSKFNHNPDITIARNNRHLPTPLGKAQLHSQPVIIKKSKRIQIGHYQDPLMSSVQW